MDNATHRARTILLLAIRTPQFEPLIRNKFTDLELEDLVRIATAKGGCTCPCEEDMRQVVQIILS